MGVLRHNFEPEKVEYTEEEIQKRLNSFFSPSSVLYSIDGLFVFDWESDKLIKMRSGLIYEFEIKISKADFKNDFNKVDKHIILEGDYEKHKIIPKGEKLIKDEEERSRNRAYYGYDSVEMTKKHVYSNEYYLVENHKRPNFFYYVTPVGMLDESDIPPYAGLIEINDYGTFITVKKAPKLHDVKYTNDELNLCDKFYYNMDNWRKKYESQTNNIKKYKDKIDELTNREGSSKKSYVQLEKENEKYKKENKALDAIWKQNQKTIESLTDELYDRNTYCKKLERKIREFDKDFDFGTFFDSKDRN